MNVLWRTLRSGARARVLIGFAVAGVVAGGVATALAVRPARPTAAPVPSLPPVTLPPTPPPTPVPTPVPTPTPVPPPPAQISAESTLEAERRLDELGYWTGPIDGTLDAATRHALIAFQKVEGRPRTGVLTPDELQAIRTAVRPRARVGGHEHLEVDLKRQVLLFVKTGGAVERVLPVSTGSGKKFTSQGWTRRAVTPRGRFTVSRKIAGWRVSPLGRLHYPSYIVGGIAVHGYSSVPTHPASHGCIRVPMFASIQAHRMMPVGTVVIVHDGGPLQQEGDVASPPGMDSPDASSPAPPTSPEPTASPSPSPATPSPSVTAPPSVSPSPTPSPAATPSPTA